MGNGSFGRFQQSNDDDDNNNDGIVCSLLCSFEQRFCYWCSQSHTVSANKLVKIPRLRKLWTENMIIYHWLFSDGCVCVFFLHFEALNEADFAIFFFDYAFKWLGVFEIQVEVSERASEEDEEKNCNLIPNITIIDQLPLPNDLWAVSCRVLSILHTLFYSMHVFSWKKKHTRKKLVSIPDMIYRSNFKMFAPAHKHKRYIFSVWSRCLVSRMHTYNRSSICYSSTSSPRLAEIFRSKWFSFICYHDIYTTTPLLCPGLFNKKPQKCLRPNKQANSPLQTARRTIPHWFEVMSSWVATSIVVVRRRDGRMRSGNGIICTVLTVSHACSFVTHTHKRTGEFNSVTSILVHYRELFPFLSLSVCVASES